METKALYIDGGWREPATTETIEVVNPATEQVIAAVPAAGADDVAAAVEAARRAADSWAATSPEQRAGFLARVRDGLRARQDEVARAIATDLGAPLKLATQLHVGLPATVLDSYVTLLGSYQFTEKIGNSLVLAEPIGVVGAITPWNYPLHQPVAKVAAALAAGCPVVLKPAEDAPLAAYLLTELIHDAGLPPGVFNLVPGRGPAAGEALVSHPDVNMVSFTGSTAVGRRVAQIAGRTLKRVALELGGKSASVILPGADLPKAVSVSVGNAYLNSGQTCSAWTRLLVHNGAYGEAVALAEQASKKYRLGDPFDPDTRLGPLVADRQRVRVRSYIEKGLSDGAHLVAGGAEPPDGIENGYFVRPTVFAEVRPDAAIAQEEIFGPVLSILRYDDEDEAVDIANGTPYGLAGAVWAADSDRASSFARRLRTGQVDINGGRFNPVAPFGGYKQSGLGRELGHHGLAEFLQYKSLQF